MRFAHEHPEEYAEIAALPLNQQNAALRQAIGYDPDRIREDAEEAAALSRLDAMNERRVMEREEREP